MSITNTCRHCGNVIGKLDQKAISASNLEFNQLSPDDKRKMIEFHSSGDVSIYTICESCETSLEHHPHYHELDYFIH